MNPILRITLFFIIVLSQASCKEAPSILSNEEIYAVVNEIIKDDSLVISKLCAHPDYVDISWEVAGELSEADINFLKHQQQSNSAFQFTANKLNYHNNLAQKNVPVAIDTSCDAGSIFHISIPLLSIDRTKVLIKITDDCNCILGGHGGTYLYEKINGHWKRIKSWDTWIG